MPSLECVREVADPVGRGTLEAFVWLPVSGLPEWVAGVRCRAEGALVAGDAIALTYDLGNRSAAHKEALRLLREQVAKRTRPAPVQATLFGGEA